LEKFSIHHVNLDVEVSGTSWFSTADTDSAIQPKKVRIIEARRKTRSNGTFHPSGFHCTSSMVSNIGKSKMLTTTGSKMNRMHMHIIRQHRMHISIKCSS